MTDLSREIERFIGDRSLTVNFIARRLKKNTGTLYRCMKNNPDTFRQLPNKRWTVRGHTLEWPEGFKDDKNEKDLSDAFNCAVRDRDKTQLQKLIDVLNTLVELYQERVRYLDRYISEMVEIRTYKDEPQYITFGTLARAHETIEDTEINYRGWIEGGMNWLRENTKYE